MRTAGSAGSAPAARVWAWSEECRTWSFGGRTARDGSIDLSVSRFHGLVVRPASKAAPRTELFGLELASNELVLPLGGQ